MYNFFKQNELNVKYHGYDFVPEIIKNNNKKFQLDSDVNFSFQILKILTTFRQIMMGIISRVFNNNEKIALSFINCYKTMYLNSKKVLCLICSQHMLIIMMKI